MANLEIRDGTHDAKFLKATGTGTDGDPYVPVNQPNVPFEYAAFGELKVAEKTPQVQVKFPYGLNTDIVQSLTNKAASTVSQALRS